MIIGKEKKLIEKSIELKFSDRVVRARSRIIESFGSTWEIK